MHLIPTGNWKFWGLMYQNSTSHAFNFSVHWRAHSTVQGAAKKYYTGLNRYGEERLLWWTYHTSTCLSAKAIFPELLIRIKSPAAHHNSNKKLCLALLCMTCLHLLAWFIMPYNTCRSDQPLSWIWPLCSSPCWPQLFLLINFLLINSPWLAWSHACYVRLGSLFSPVNTYY